MHCSVRTKDSTGSANEEWRWFWVTLTLSSISVVAVVFSAWELVEYQFFRELDYVALHYLYVTRGIVSSLLLAFWAAWYVLRQQRRDAEVLHRSREHYRGLLEASPGAVALYDSTLRVREWNASAERLYGYSKAEVLARPLPTVPPETSEELTRFLEQVSRGESVTDAETLRMDRNGRRLDVQLSLLPFRQSAGMDYHLEVTTDIHGRLRLQRKLLEVERLTSMGRMAAGTAHHLNTPLTAMLLRAQMMRERCHPGVTAADLERLETGIHSCLQFVRRMLEFSRPALVEKQPVDLALSIESIMNFLAPTLAAKQTRILTDLSGLHGEKVMADTNLLEALISILISNALDATGQRGAINVRCRRLETDSVEIEIADDGPGIDPSDLPHIFEPFFTTKAPGQGTGLGLAIARNIVADHGGSIRLDTGPGRGTTARVKLPVHRPVDRHSEMES